MDLDGPLRAQRALKVERPPTLWEADTETKPFLALLGELIALGLGRGNELAELTLNVANVVVEPDDEDGSIPEGEYVAITVRDRGASPRPEPCVRLEPQPERPGRFTGIRGTSATRARSPWSSLASPDPRDSVDPVDAVVEPLVVRFSVDVHADLLGHPAGGSVLRSHQ